LISRSSCSSIIEFVIIRCCPGLTFGRHYVEGNKVAPYDWAGRARLSTLYAISTTVDSMESKFQLVPDSQARNKAIVKVGEKIESGEVILRVPSLVTSLLPNWKGRRCDWCCRRNSQLKACSACKEVSYCSSGCK
jgi:hypothetical protein